MYWAEAVATAAYTQNRLLTSTLNQETPYQRWYDKQPNVSHMKVFGCVAYLHVPDTERWKLDKKAVRLRFVGYANNAKGYRMFDEEKLKILIRRDVVIFQILTGNKKWKILVQRTNLSWKLTREHQSMLMLMKLQKVTESEKHPKDMDMMSMLIW